MGSVVHKEKLDIVDVADEESLVAGGGHVAGLLVGAIADLKSHRISTKFHVPPHRKSIILIRPRKGSTYRGHGNGAAESSSDTAVDTLRLAPAGVDTLEAITLVTLEALRAYTHKSAF